jgi:twinkle protein
MGRKQRAVRVAADGWGGDGGMSTQTWADVGIDAPLGHGEVDVLCPKCSHLRKRQNQRKKPLGLNLDEQTWFCHNCGWKGSLRQTEDWRTRKAMPKVYAKPEVDTTYPRTAAMEQFFTKRGISLDAVKRLNVYAADYKGAAAIAYPFTRDGEVVTIKYRLPNKRHAMTEGAEQIPWGLDDVVGAETVVIVEGEPDKLAIETATGITAVLSPPNGASISDRVGELIAEAVADAKRVLLAGDMDSDGAKMMENLSKRIGYDRCWRVVWPEKDANDTLMEHGADVVTRCVVDAKPYPVQGIFSIDDLADRYHELYESGMPGGRSTGWPELDRYYTVREGQLTVITGTPGSGKSVWWDALFVNLAQGGMKFAVFSPEQLPHERQMSQWARILVGKPFAMGPTARMTPEEKDTALDWMRDRVWFVGPEENTMDAVLERALTVKRRYGIDGLVIDPWNELDHARPNGVTETEYVHQCLTRLRHFCRNHAVHVWLVAHPTKLRKGENGQMPVATPYDINGSAGFFNKADCCLSVWRDKEDEDVPVQVHIQKVRFQEIGGLGCVEFRYNRLNGRYTTAGSAWVSFGMPVDDVFPEYGE